MNDHTDQYIKIKQSILVYIDIDISSNFQNLNSIKSVQNRYVNLHNYHKYVGGIVHTNFINGR